MSVTSHNHIKVGPSSKNAKTVGNFSFGVSGGDDYGPTTTTITGGTGTGFYNGIVPPVGGYTLYQQVGGNIYARVANDDAECILILKDYGYTGADNITDALIWANTQSDVISRPAEYTLSDLPGASQATTGQTSLLITTIDGSPNWHYVIFDFTNNLITTPYDMGAVVSDYENSNYINSTVYGGYIVTLHSTNDWNTQKHYFISANGVLVESYDTTGSTDSSTDFIAQYLQDYNNSILKYFDGIHVYTRDYSTLGYNQFYVSYNYDLGGSDGGILTYWYDGTTGYIENNYQGNVILLKSYNINAYNIDPQSYVMSNYTFLIQQHSSGDYYRMDIVDNQTGNLLQRIPLDDYSYQNYNLDFYGMGKGIVLFQNYGDTSVPWRMINYDGVTDTLIVTDQPNDGNYNDYNINYTTDYPYLDDGNPSESAFVEFYNNSYNSYNNFIYLYGYYKTYSFYDGCSTPNIYTLNDTGALDKGVSYNSQISNHFYRLISTGLTTLEISILGEPTEQIIETNIVVYDNAGNGGMDDANTSIMGDNLFMMTFSGNSTNASTAYVFGKISGNTYGMRASLSLDNNNYDYWRGNGFVYFIDFDNSQAWYFNDAVSGFTQVDYLSNIGSSNTNYTYRPPNFERRPTYVFYSRDTFEAYVLTKNSMSPKVTLEPNNGNYEFEIGDSGLMYIYNNTSDGAVVIDVYDLTMSRTQRIVTTEYSYNDYYIIGNRYIVETSDGSGNKVYYRITPTTHESITLPSNGYDNGPTANDPIA
jgi:hypothetical protein